MSRNPKLPNPDALPPFVVERREVHPSGAVHVLYLSPGGQFVGDRTYGPARWVPFGYAKAFGTLREAKAAFLHLATDTAEPHIESDFAIRTYDEVMAERSAQQLGPDADVLASVIEDFRKGADEERAAVRLALIGRARMAAKGLIPPPRPDEWRLEPSSQDTLGHVLDFGL